MKKNKNYSGAELKVLNVVLAPLLDEPNRIVVYRNNGQEVVCKTERGEIISSTHRLDNFERTAVERMLKEKNNG